MIRFGAEPTAAGGLDPQAVAGRQLSLRLRGQRLAVEQVATRRSGLPAVAALGRMTAALADQRVSHRLQGLQLPGDALAAPGSPRATAPTARRELLDQAGVVG